jgi:hypothetical protein
MRNYCTNTGLEVSHCMRVEDLSSELWCPMIFNSFFGEKCVFSIFSCCSEINRASSPCNRVKCFPEHAVPHPTRGTTRGGGGVNLLWLLWSVRNYFWVGIRESYFYVAPAHERSLILFILFRYDFYLRIVHFSVRFGIDCLLNVLVKHS